jgi:hypothetical protein
MPIGFLKGNGASINIQLDRHEEPYYPGDPILVDFSLQTEKELKIRQFRAGLLAWENFTQEDSEGDETTRSTLNEYIEEHILLDNETLPPGISREFRQSWRIPEDAFPPYSSGLIGSGYSVEAVIDLGLKRNIREQVPVRVVIPPPGIEIHPGEYGEISHSESVDMRLWLPRLEWIEGESIDGELIIIPKEKIGATGVRLQINREQRVHAPRFKINNYDVVGKDQVYGKIKFEPGRSHKFPFSLSIPEAGAPSRKTEATTVTYKIEGIISRRLRRDFKVNTEVHVHNAPSSR